MKKQKMILYVMQKMSYFHSYLKMSNYESYYDVNNIAEGFIMNLLNILYSLNLKDMNQVKRNYPGIDLGDEKEGIAVQVTSRRDIKKIKDTYDKIFKNKISDKIVADIFSKKIYFFILDMEHIKLDNKTIESINKHAKGRFSGEDIITLKDIITEIRDLYDNDYNKFQMIYELISNNIDDLPELKSDNVIVEELVALFNRPAFKTDFRMECNMEDFENAIKETISYINIGKIDNGKEIGYSINDIQSSEIKNNFKQIVDGLDRLRYRYLQFKHEGKIQKCGCNNPNCNILICKDFEVCRCMNKLREIILKSLLKIYNSDLGYSSISLIDKMDDMFNRFNFWDKNKCI